MKLSITQPYFFPYIGFFQLIFHTDEMIIFDTVKYQKRTWMNRNRILHPTKDFNYITVPIKKHPLNTTIENIEIVNDEKWKKKILGQITIYAKKAPYYKNVTKLLLKCFEINEKSYARLSIRIIATICEYLDLDFSYEYLSKKNLNLPEIKTAGDWSYLICEAVGSKHYVNMPGGVTIFDEREFLQRNIQLSFLNPTLKTYNQMKEDFTSHLCIIDVLMWNSKEKVLRMIKNDFNIVSKDDLQKRYN